MQKIILPSSYGFDQPTASLIDSHRSRIDTDLLVKRASSPAIIEKFASFKPRPGHSLIHLIAMGSTDRYPANRNGDAFYKAARVFQFPETDWDSQQLANGRTHTKSADTFTDRTATGLIDQYPTFVSHGDVYWHHKNKKHAGDTVYGSIKAAEYNHPMDRVELLIEVDNDRWGADLEKMAAGDDLSFSMSCFLDPKFPILTHEGYKGIADVQIGDRVLTHTGQWKKVTKLIRRSYSGKAVSLRVDGLPGSFEVTEEHPFWAKHFSGSQNKAAIQSKSQRLFNDPEAFEQEPFQWVDAENVGVGDQLCYRPAPGFDHLPGISDINMARFLGYYLAEGSVSGCKGNPDTVNLACNYDDSLPRDITEIVRSIKDDAKVSISPHRDSKKGLSVNIYSAGLSKFAATYVGQDCRAKRIPLEIFNSQEDVKIAFLGAWFDGAGFIDLKGLHWSSVNYDLILQGRDLLATIGIGSSIYRIEHADNRQGPDGKPIKGSIEYTLNVPRIDGDRFSAWSKKVQNTSYDLGEDRREPAALRTCPDGTFSYQVKSVTHYEVTDVPVYNLEVEDDHSFCAAGVATHNCSVPFDICSVCGHKARNRGEYCKHAAYQLGQLTKSGHSISVINEKPVFFDISKVHRPADRIAVALTKAAKDQTVVGGAELAEQYGVLDPLDEAVLAADPDRVARRTELIHKMARMEKEIPVEGRVQSIRRVLAHQPEEDTADFSSENDSQSKCASVLEYLHSKGACLPFRRFVDVLVPSEKRAALQSVIDEADRHLPTLYRRLSERPTAVAANLGYDGEAGRDPLDKKARDLADRYGLTDQAIRLRTLRVPADTQARDLQKQAESSPSPAAAAALDQYAAYQLSFVESNLVTAPQAPAMVVAQNLA